MKLYTKTGDDGTTGLFGGARVSKDDPRVRAYGQVDELNAALGLVLASIQESESQPILRQVQSDLFDLGAELATPPPKAPASMIGAEHVTRLERWMDEACATVAPLRSFVLPGGGEAAARLHLARAICRRAERDVVALAREQTFRPMVIVYLNRLSDLLFALARAENRRAGIEDVPWTPRPAE
jgi:cob(I)alamin adenosyltransferase